MLNDIHRAGHEARHQGSPLHRRKYAALVEKGELQRAERAINDKHADHSRHRARGESRATAYSAARKRARPTKAAPATKAEPVPRKQRPPRIRAGRGFQARPQNSLINWRKTTTQMQLDGKYILRDGKKVVVSTNFARFPARTLCSSLRAGLSPKNGANRGSLRGSDSRQPRRLRCTAHARGPTHSTVSGWLSGENETTSKPTNR
jgi:hypothetical protein